MESPDSILGARDWLVSSLAASSAGEAWQPFWAAHGFVNATVLKPGAAVSLPMILVLDDEAFVQIANLRYMSHAEKSGTARLRPVSDPGRDTTAAGFIIHDKSNSNMTTIAQNTTVNKVL